MEVEISWSPKSMEDFRKQIQYLEENFGRRTANLFMEKTFDILEKVARMDVVSYQVIDSKRSIHKFKIYKFLDLYYRVKAENHIELITFFDSRQNPKKLKL